MQDNLGLVVLEDMYLARLCLSKLLKWMCFEQVSGGILVKGMCGGGNMWGREGKGRRRD